MPKVIANIFICGTSCYTDEGVEFGHNYGDYGEYGYTPVGMYHRINSFPENALPVIVPGPGDPYHQAFKDLWIAPSDQYVQGWTTEAIDGWLSGFVDGLAGGSMEDLAGHAAAVAAGVRTMGRATVPKKTDYRKKLIELIQKKGVNPKGRALSGSEEMKCLQFDTHALELLASKFTRDKVKIEKGDVINLCGHSRGGVACIIASHDLSRLFPDVDINIFAIDPVPGGGGNWTHEMTHLGPNVKNYVGVYAIDEVSAFFNGVVPWPSTKMVENPEDPLASNKVWKANPKGYLLLHAPGKHSTVAGNISECGGGGIVKGSDKVGKGQKEVGDLVGTLATLAFKAWGAKLADLPGVKKAWNESKKIIDAQSKSFRAMRGYTYDAKITSSWNPITIHWAERGVSSSNGKWNSSSWCYLENAINAFPLVQRKSWGSGLFIEYNDMERRAANWLPLNSYYGDLAQYLEAHWS